MTRQAMRPAIPAAMGKISLAGLGDRVRREINRRSAMEVVFLAESVSAETWQQNKMRVVVEVEPEELLDSLDVEDRIKGLDEHEVIIAMGINKTLNLLDEKELTDWIKSSDIDPIDLLNAIGEESIYEWINSQE
jgi:ribosomal protein L7Ae-like RNA K-turn-binding protein